MHIQDSTTCSSPRNCYVFSYGEGVNPYDGAYYGVGEDRDVCYRVGYRCGYYGQFAWLFFLNMLMRGSEDTLIRENAYSWTDGYFMGRSDKKNGYPSKH